MKYDTIRLVKVAALFFFTIMILVTGLLLREYYYFHVLTGELIDVKQEYSNYILAFKRMVRDEEQDSSNQEFSTLGEKKKLNSSRDLTFLVVNRDSEYSKKAALAFAQRQGLGQPLLHFYDAHERSGIVVVQRERRRRKIQRSSSRKGSFNAHQQTNRWDHLKREPIFIWPIDKKNFWLSSPFGPRKYKGVWGFHTGIDMAAVRGTPVAAALDGVVSEAGFSVGYGNTIVIIHNKKFKTRYAHLEKLLVRNGQKVSVGDIIGKVGDTGNVRKKGKDASHLHFEVYVFGKQVNPFYFLI